MSSKPNVKLHQLKGKLVFHKHNTEKKNENMVSPKCGEDASSSDLFVRWNNRSFKFFFELAWKKRIFSDILNKKDFVKGA